MGGRRDRGAIRRKEGSNIKEIENRGIQQKEREERERDVGQKAAREIERDGA